MLLKAGETKTLTFQISRQRASLLWYSMYSTFYFERSSGTTWLSTGLMASSWQNLASSTFGFPAAQYGPQTPVSGNFYVHGVC